MNIYYSLKIFLINIIFVHLSILEDNGCLSWIEKHVYDNSELHSIMGPSILIKFEDFSELKNFSCPNDKLKTDMLILYPNRNILIDSDIDFVKKFKFITFDLGIFIENILGFNFKQGQGKSKNIPFFRLFFNNVVLDFFINNTIVTSDMCNKKYFNDTKMNFFAFTKYVFFNDDVIYRKTLCPYVFRNAYLENLGLFKITNSLLYKNQLEFLSLNKTSSIDSNIFQLTLNIMYEDLTLKIMNKHVFENIRSLHLVGSINRIQKDLFDHFKKLKSISLITDDLQAFFHNSIEWVSYLNKDIIIQNFTRELFLNGYKIFSFVQFVETESPFVKS
jgi:hypothetical protein